MAHHHHNVQQPPEGYERWVCLYPTYINRDRTVAEGRRIPKDKAVPTPLLDEMMSVLCVPGFGLKAVCERKIYCRENFLDKQNYGRIRVELKTPDGVYLNPNIKCRKDLYLYVAEKIPQLKSRTNPRPVQEAQPQKGGKNKKKK